jgi:hypothetical protein
MAEDLKDTLDTLNKTLSNLSTSVGPLPTSLSLVDNKVESLGESIKKLNTAIGKIKPNKDVETFIEALDKSKAMKDISSLIDATEGANQRAELEQDSRTQYIDALKTQTEEIKKLQKTNNDRLEYDKQQEENKKKEKTLQAALPKQEKSTGNIYEDNSAFQVIDKKLSSIDEKIKEFEKGKGKGYTAAKERINKNIEKFKIEGKDPAELGALEKILKVTGASKYTDKFLDKVGKAQQKDLDKLMPKQAREYKKLQREKKKLTKSQEGVESAIEKTVLGPEGNLEGVAAAETEKILKRKKLTPEEKAAIAKAPVVDFSEKKQTPLTPEEQKRRDEFEKQAMAEEMGQPTKEEKKEATGRIEVEIVDINDEVIKALSGEIANAIKDVLEEEEVDKNAKDQQKQDEIKAEKNQLPETLKTPEQIKEEEKRLARNARSERALAAKRAGAGGAGTGTGAGAGGAGTGTGAGAGGAGTGAGTGAGGAGEGAVLNAAAAGNAAETAAVTALEGVLAEGGPANKKDTYLVGERGPELFTPNTDGKVIPNSELKTMLGKKGGVKGTSALQQAAEGPKNTTNVTNTTMDGDVTGTSVTENVAQSNTNISAEPSEALKTVASTPTTVTNSTQADNSDMLTAINQTLREISDKLSITPTATNNGGGVLANNSTVHTYNITTQGNPITNSRMKTDNMMYARRAAN